MEKFFTNKSIWKKIVIAILVIMAFQVICKVPIVRAAKTDDAAQDGDNLVSRGVLMRPVMSLLVSLGDGVMGILHSQIMGQEDTLLAIDLDTDLGVIGLLVGLLLGIALAIFVTALIASGLVALAPLFELIGGSAVSIGAGTMVFAAATGTVAGFAIYNASLPETLYLPAYTYSAEEIFQGNILLFNIDFFNLEPKEIRVHYKDPDTPGKVTTNEQGRYAGQEDTIIGQEYDDTYKDYESKIKEGKGPFEVLYYYYYKDSMEVRTSPQDSAMELRNVIAGWYVSIRNICVVGMMSILVYIGIKMMLTTVASDKAKYIEMFKDWLVGLCLLFVMQYIMVFSVMIVNKITEMINTSVDKNFYLAIIQDKDDKIKNAIEKNSPELLQYMSSDGYLYYPTNLMGYLRIEMQKVDGRVDYLGYVICYLVLVIYTVIFTFTYLKRLLYMAFFTIIAPLVAMTYPIDKINDGQAQGFNAWLKEYIFNLLIQPVHLLLYYILVTSAIQLAEKNVIYSLVALGFMLPAEKILRGFFGFEKAKTPPVLGGPVGTALMMQGISGLSRLAKGPVGSSGGAGSSASSSDDQSKIKARKMDEFDAFAAGEGGETEADGGAIPGITDQDSYNKRKELAKAYSDNKQESFNDWYNRKQSSSETGGEAISGVKDQLALANEYLGEKQETFNEWYNRTHSQDETNNPSDKAEAVEGKQTGATKINSGNPTGTSRKQARKATTVPNVNSTTSNQSKNSDYVRPIVPHSQVKRRLSSMGTAFGTQFKSTFKNSPKMLGKAAFKAAGGVAKRIPGAAMGLAAGAAAATLGGALAIASGDPKNIMTAAGTAAGVGATVGSRISNTMTTTNLDEDTQNAIQAAKAVYYDDKYVEEDREKEYQKAKVNDLNRIKARKALGSDAKVEEFMNGNLHKWMSEGETDFEDMLAMQQLVNEKGISADESRATMGMLRRTGNVDPLKMGHKDRDDLHNTLTDGLIARNVGEKRANQRANQIENNMSALHKIRYGRGWL